MFSTRPTAPFRTGVLLVEFLSGAVCLYLCWQAVRWALQPGLFMILDEISNLSRYMGGLSWAGATILPHFAYNDRPAGFALERWWFELFGFNYRPQLAFLLLLHLGNLVLGFFLFRRLGASILASFAALCVFGTLSTTAQTVTFLGAVFDVLCLFLLLASVLAFVSRKRGSAALSAILFFLALRTKEFAIVLPVLLLAIAYCEQIPSPARRGTYVLRRLWIHLAIWAVFLGQYAWLIRGMVATLPAGNPYTIRANFATVLDSFSYYTALIFHVEGHPRKSYLILALVFTMAGYALYRRRGWIMWAFAAFLLTLLPVSIIPGNRAEFYVYAPALFLLLAADLTVEDMMGRLIPNERTRWCATVAAVVVVLISVAHFQRGPYFLNRVAYRVGVRKVAAVTAADGTTLLPSLVPDSWLFVYQGANISWLLFPGPCDFFNLPQHRQSFHCVLSGSIDEVNRLYQAHEQPKYYMVYGADGSLRMSGAPGSFAAAR